MFNPVSAFIIQSRQCSRPVEAAMSPICCVTSQASGDFASQQQFDAQPNRLMHELQNYNSRSS
jgi:hypothetical protein